MSSNLGEEVFLIGQRLREERERLGLSQELLGTRLGTTGRTIKKYEANETSIRAVELLQFSGLGADVLYVITGNRLPLEAADTETTTTAARRLALVIANLDLTQEDAEFVRSMALRLAK